MGDDRSHLAYHITFLIFGSRFVTLCSAYLDNAELLELVIVLTLDNAELLGLDKPIPERRTVKAVEGSILVSSVMDTVALETGSWSTAVLITEMALSVLDFLVPTCISLLDLTLSSLSFLRYDLLALFKLAYSSEL